MTTLRIEHPITDFAVWHAAFERFTEMRERAGVIAHRVWRPLDDDHFVTLDLEFASRGQQPRPRRFTGDAVPRASLLSRGTRAIR